MKIDKLGWVVAAALLGGIVGVGFQGANLKIGTVDMRKVLDDSEYAKSQNERLRTLQANRQSILEYMQAYKAAKPEDATKFRELSIKENPTAADKTALEAVKTAIQTDDQKFKALQTKANPTPEETTQLQEYNRRAQQLQALQQRWAREFDDELGGVYSKLRDDAVARVKTAVQDVAKQQGYSVVFSSETAPYAANDLTADALKSMNSKK